MSLAGRTTASDSDTGIGSVMKGFDYSLVASPSWYCSRVSDTHNELFLFGGKSAVYGLDISSSPIRFVVSFQAHSDRITGLSIQKTACEPNGFISFVTAAEDNFIKIWKWKSTEELPKSNDEHNNHVGKPTVVHWSSKDPNLIVSGDDKGTLIAWRLLKNQLQSWVYETSPIFCVECSPHDEDHVAIGFKSGSILIVDIRRGGDILHKLHGHDEEVQSITWCPLPGETPTEAAGPQTGHMLASGCRDRTIRVWSASRGKCLMTLKLPAGSHHMYRFESKTRVYCTLFWDPTRPFNLLSSTQHGEVIIWDLTKPGRGQKWSSFAPGHQRIIFNISGSDRTVCSISMDRKITIYDLESMAIRETIETLGGFVYCAVQSPLHPGRLALGVGDNQLRVWNTANDSKPHDCQNFWQGIKSKVTALAWHPTREGLLAYGTDEGRVGIYDILSNKNPKISTTYHRGTVYVVTWGPACYAKDKKIGDSDQHHHLFSCGNSLVLMHDPGQLHTEAVDIHYIMNQSSNQQIRYPGRSEVSWKPDNTVVALGNDDGSVDIHRAPSLELIYHFQAHRKLINVCRWHPQMDSDGQTSKYQFWLATGSNESSVNVFDLENYISRGLNGEIIEPFCHLEGHGHRVTGLCWSPHHAEQLVSCSYDGSAQVWDVMKGAPLANFRGHFGRLYCVQWCPLNEDIVYTGGDDHALRRWRISEQTEKLPPKFNILHDKKKKKTRKNKNKVPDSQQNHTVVEHQIVNASISNHILNEPIEGDEAPRANHNKTELENLMAMLEEKRKDLENQQTKTESIPSSCSEVLKDHDILPKTVTETTCQIKEDGDSNETTQSSKIASHYSSKLHEDITSKESFKIEVKKKRKQKSLFPVYGMKENKPKKEMYEDIMTLSTSLYSDIPEFPDEIQHLGIFGNCDHATRMMEQEDAYHMKQLNSEQQGLLSLYQGDLGIHIRQAAKNGTLSDWLMSMASMVSPYLWQEMCPLFAKQLEAAGFIHKATSYLLAVHQVHDAIHMLRRNNLYKDAACLARVRLDDEDPIIAELYSSWAEEALKDQNYELAAKCYIALRLPKDAARILSSRQNQLGLKAACHICLVSNEMEACKMYSQLFFKICLLKCDWKAGEEVSHWLTDFQPESLLLSTHELLCQEILENDEEMLGDVKPTWHFTETAEEVKLPKIIAVTSETNSKSAAWQPHLVQGQQFILHLLRIWCHFWKNELNIGKIQHAYRTLAKEPNDNVVHTTVAQMLVDISRTVALGVLSLLLCDMDQSCHWFSVALHLCNKSDTSNLMINISRILLPFGPEYILETQKQVTSLRLSITPDWSHVRNPTTPSQFVLATPTDAIVISNPSTECSGYDCLRAYYSLAMLRYLHENKSLLIDEPAEMEKELSNCPDGETDEEAPLKDLAVEDDSNYPRKLNALKMSTRDIIDSIPQMLLWDVQARKSLIQASLAEIKKCLSNLRRLNSSGTGTEQIFGLQRTLSGEYLSMAPVSDSVSRKHAWEPYPAVLRRDSTGSSDGEWVDMNDPEDESSLLNDSMLEDITEGKELKFENENKEESDVQKGEKCTRGAIVNRNLGKQSNAVLKSIVDPSRQNESEERISEDDNQKLAIDNRMDKVGVEEIYSDWTRDLLVMELNKLVAENQKLASVVKETPFPDVLHTCKLFMDVFSDIAYLSKTKASIATWAYQNSITTDQRIFYYSLK